MYKPISKRLAIAAYYIRWYFAAIHLGGRNAPDCPWLQYPSFVSLAVCLTDWTLGRAHLTNSYGSRPGGLAFKNGKTMALVSSTLTLSLLCFTLAVLVYRHSDKDVA